MNRETLAIIAACMMVFGALPLGVTSAQTTSFDADAGLSAWGGKTTQVTASLFSPRGSFQATDGIVTHGDGLPGWYIKYRDESYDSVETWLESSDERTLIRHDNDSNRVLVSAPADHIRRGSWLGFVKDGVYSASWVEWVEVEQSITLDTVGTLDEKPSEDEFESSYTTRRQRWIVELETLSGGELTADGIAWGDDVNRTNMSEVRDTVAADSSSISTSTANGSGVNLAVLDTGINVGAASDRGRVFGNGSSKSELRITAAKNFVTGETVDTSKSDENASWEKVEDGDGHGTYVAARAAGAANGTKSERGIAYDANLTIAKTLDDDGSGSIDNIVRGLEWACTEQNADVVSMSLGSTQYSKVLDEEIHECLSEDDVSAVVVAAGNNRWTYRWVNSPADSDGVITVGATDTGDGNASDVRSAYFSSVGEDPGTTDGSGTYTRGETVDVVSPGMANTVRSVSSSGTLTNSTLSGTSMSTPDVSAAIAVLLDVDPSLKGDHEAVATRVRETATAAPEVGVTEAGHGVLSVSNLLDDTRPALDQDDARTAQAEERDRANYALAGRFAQWLGAEGVNFKI